ncbi:hypothetical protein CBL_05324 [Carabus blaptoides fortunei]
MYSPAPRCGRVDSLVNWSDTFAPLETMFPWNHRMRKRDARCERFLDEDGLFFCAENVTVFNGCATLLDKRHLCVDHGDDHGADGSGGGGVGLLINRLTYQTPTKAVCAWMNCSQWNEYEDTGIFFIGKASCFYEDEQNEKYTEPPGASQPFDAVFRRSTINHWNATLQFLPTPCRPRIVRDVRMWSLASHSPSVLGPLSPSSSVLSARESPQEKGLLTAVPAFNVVVQN